MANYLSTKDVAGMLEVSQRTIENWRMLDEGPSYIKIGKLIRYRKSDIEMWIDANHHSVSTESRAKRENRDVK